MNNASGFKRKLSIVSRLWEAKDYDAALAEVESLLATWPGNAHLHVLQASLIQLQEDPKYDLAEVKSLLRHAVELDRGSSAAAIELGHFLDTVEDDPQAAVKAYAEGVSTARNLLIDALIGRAKAFLQLGKRSECKECVLEVMHLSSYQSASRRSKSDDTESDYISDALLSRLVQAMPPKGPNLEKLQDILNELMAARSACEGNG
jgi:hypothetical protein